MHDESCGVRANSCLGIAAIVFGGVAGVTAADVPSIMVNKDAPIGTPIVPNASATYKRLGRRAGVDVLLNQLGRSLRL